MIMTLKNIFLAILFVCLSLSIDAKARLRGKDFDALEARARNPTIADHIRGKTLKDLGIKDIDFDDKEIQSRRKAQGQTPVEDDDSIQSYIYFSVYNEFDTTGLTTLGQSAGSRGMIYNRAAKDEGLTEDLVQGALQGSCSLVSSDGKQLCSYEFFLFNDETGTMGTVIATGTVQNEVGTNSVLIIEATGDDFVQYEGGMVIIKYTAIGESTAMNLRIDLRRKERPTQNALSRPNIGTLPSK